MCRALVKVVDRMVHIKCEDWYDSNFKSIKQHFSLISGATVRHISQATKSLLP